MRLSTLVISPLGTAVDAHEARVIAVGKFRPEQRNRERLERIQASSPVKGNAKGGVQHVLVRPVEVVVMKRDGGGQDVTPEARPTTEDLLQGPLVC